MSFHKDDHDNTKCVGRVVVIDESFDYGVVTPSVAKFLKGQAERIRHLCATSIIQIGKSLIEAKRHLSHGAFLQWVQYEVHLPARTAQAYMRVANWASSKRATVAHLTPTVLYLLSAPSTPEDFSTNILAQIEADGPIAPSALRKALKERQLQGRFNDPEHSETMPVSHLRTVNVDGSDADVLQDLKSIVEMLRNRLSSYEFEELRRILTDKKVLRNPDLPFKIMKVLKRHPKKSVGEPSGRVDRG